MFYPLLDLIVCPACQAELVLVCPVERPQATTMHMPSAHRLGAPGAPVGPLPSTPADTPLWRLLAQHASAAVPVGRDQEFGIAEGVLVCAHCQRWYPIRDGLPELLPDYLRAWDEHQPWLAARRPAFEAAGLEAVWQALMAGAPAPAQPVADPGAHYKHSEMAITRRHLPAGFFGPAMVAPFNPLRPQYGLDLLARYVTTVSRLGCGLQAPVLDIGVGYAWTTEWLVRLGYQAVGVDITRDYILAGLPRLGANLPHLIIADTENLPLRAECMDAILSFDAFHHLPDRPRAMLALARVMRPGARLVLVEPGKEHEAHPASIAIMQQHGILERGFDQADLAGYIDGTALGDIEHHTSDTHPHDIFVVRKTGTFETDSRTPRILVAEIIVEQPPGRVEAGRLPALTVSIVNIGDTTWLHTTPDGWGEVQLGASLFDGQHNLVQEVYARWRLPRSLRPGQQLRLQCGLPAIPQPGQYWIELDLVDNGLLWFKDFAYRAVQVPLEVFAAASELAPGAPETPPAAAGSALTSATELSFDPDYLKRNTPVSNPRVPPHLMPAVVWQTLREAGPLTVIRKSLRYFRPP